MKKSCFIAIAAIMMLAFGGCGTSANNLGGATDGYGYDNNSYGYNNYDGYNTGTYNTSGGAAYWDGYGVNSGRPLTDDTSVGSTLGNDARDLGNGVAHAGRTVKNDVKNTLNNSTATVAS